MSDEQELIAARETLKNIKSLIQDGMLDYELCPDPHADYPDDPLKAANYIAGMILLEIQAFDYAYGLDKEN